MYLIIIGAFVVIDWYFIEIEGLLFNHLMAIYLFTPEIKIKALYLDH